MINPAVSLVVTMSLQLIFVSFLESQKSSNKEFLEELRSLAEAINEDDCLETDGFRSIDEPPTVELPGLDEDLCRKIGVRLAEMGDQFEREGRIDQSVVQSLTEAILAQSLTEDRFAAAVQSVVSNLPAGIEQEKACLAIAMNLTSKVGLNVPALLHSCYSTAFAYIRRNCLPSVQGLAQQI